MSGIQQQGGDLYREKGEIDASGLPRTRTELAPEMDASSAMVRVIASVEERGVAPPEVIDKILKHLGLDESSTARYRSPPNQTSADMFALP